MDGHGSCPRAEVEVVRRDPAVTRVLHLLASADRRGAEVFGHELAARLDGLGLHDEVLALAPARSGSVALDVEVLAEGPYRGLAALRRRAAAADVVVGHGSTGLPGGFLATLGARPRFVYRSIGDPAAWGAARVSSRLKVRAGLSRAAAVVSLWDGASQVIGAAYGIGPDRRAVIPNAADVERFRPTDAAGREAARRELGLGSGPVVAVIGALGPEKRAHLAVGALAAHPDATLLVVGDGPGRDQVAAAAAAHGDRVRLLPARADLGPIYRATDVVLSTSRTEGQSGVLIEARLCGLGIVATDVGGTGSVVDPAAGRLVPADPSPHQLATAVEEVLAVPPDQRAAARQRAAAAFSFATVASAWADLLDRVAADRPGSDG